MAIALSLACMLHDQLIVSHSGFHPMGVKKLSRLVPTRSMKQPAYLGHSTVDTWTSVHLPDCINVQLLVMQAPSTVVEARQGHTPSPAGAFHTLNVKKVVGGPPWTKICSTSQTVGIVSDSMV